MSLTHKRLGFLLAILGGSTLIGIFCAAPIPQDLGYHDFADKETIFAIPHFWNVISNLPFLAVGLLGWRFCLKNKAMGQRCAWLIFSLGTFLVGVGSSYYHLDPNNQTLVWDRLPMTVSFMAAFCALGAEVLGHKMERLLWPLIAAGILSVVVWAQTDDLRFYAWVQFFPLVALIFMLVCAGDRIRLKRYVVWALVYYTAAKVFENWDRGVEDLLNGLMSGHAIKHVLAACGTWELVKRLRADS